MSLALHGAGPMAEHKAPDPMWTTEKVHAVAEKIFEEYEPHCKTDLGRMFARDMATEMAQQFQLFEALNVAGRTDTAAADLAKEVAEQHRIQISALSRRLEKLEQRQDPL